MKSYQFAEHIIHCGRSDQWDELIGAATRGPGLGTVVDLRTFIEIGEQEVPKPPEGWGYRRLPLTGATVSEQDLDVFRREFFRKPQTVVVGPNETRGSLLVAASLARLEKGGWKHEQGAQEQNGNEGELFEWLTMYLVRHGCAPQAALEDARSKTATRPQAPYQGKAERTETALGSLREPDSQGHPVAQPTPGSLEMAQSPAEPSTTGTGPIPPHAEKTPSDAAAVSTPLEPRTAAPETPQPQTTPAGETSPGAAQIAPTLGDVDPVQEEEPPQRSSDEQHPRPEQARGRNKAGPKAPRKSTGRGKGKGK